ncbi:MAG: phosphomannomutase/phosphoglucomutase [Myxococcales bacterium]|jgi:phosphomannomutase/phosphoglucomutase|nr:phosphomannomutase/phosphoglucomutase [Myxococcales bacterium]MBL0194115.1 phosphomannomutase/phosphoglucomutase [Myxococcales bacterium]
MRVPSHIFREYDIRGVADRDLTDELAYGLGRGLATQLGAAAGTSSPRLCVARDCRVSSPRLHAGLLRGLTEGGVRVVDLGVGPTPMLYFGVHHLGTDGGVMITGSHNAGDENGFKIMKGKASFFGEDIQSLRRVLEEEGYAAAAKGSVEEVDVQPAYVDVMKKGFSFGASAPRFVLDAGNGAGGPLALRVMRELGLEPDPLFCDMDGTFPNHHPDPTVPKNLEALIARVKATGARVGLAFDGDADRLGAVDANGDIVWGDKLMILFSRGLLAKTPGAAVIGEVKCSQTLYDDIAKHGGRPIVWKTGHSLIKTKMKEEHAALAGEMSGHLFFADRYFGYDDATYAALRLLEILAADGRSIAELLSDVPRTFTTPEIRVECPDALKFDIVKAVTKKYKDQGRDVLDIDGARITFDKGGAPTWGLVRASNTGPILVLRFEAGSEERLAEIRAEVEATVAEERRRLAG